MPPRSRAGRTAGKKQARARKPPALTKKPPALTNKFPPPTEKPPALTKKPSALTKKPPARAPKSAPLKRKPSVAIIGAGRLGTALAVALEAEGYRVTALVARQLAHARRAARRLRTRPPALDSAQLARIPESDIFIISTPDDEIAATAERLAATLGATERPPKDQKRSRSVQTLSRTRPRVALHASGALSSDVLRPLRAAGFAVGSLHPLVSVSDAASNAKDLRGAFYCVEGDAAALRAARRVVRDLGGHSFTVEASRKALYHAAAVTASGHAVALFDLACELLALCGLSPREARRVLLPLSLGTLSNLAAAAANHSALTGPFARADASTVRRHLAALDALAERAAPRDALAAYALLGLRSLRLASAKGAASARLEEIARLLSDAAARRG